MGTIHQRASRALALLGGALAMATAVPAGGAGFKVGAQIFGVRNSLTGELPDEGSWKARLGPGAGLVAQFDLTADVALSVEPGYTRRQSRQEFAARDLVVGHVDYELDYVSLPVLVQVTGDPRGVRGFVTAGAELGFLIDATATSEGGAQDIGDEMDSTTIGALFGAGVMIPVRRQFLTLEARYMQGLDDIVHRGSTPATVPQFTSPSVKYRGLQFMLGLLFPFGGE